MSLLLGIDTGGTYTDAVVFDDEQGVVASAKALTTKHDLAIGIREALTSVMGCTPGKIQLVSLSTTLATNSVVEGQGSPVGLLLIGYDPATMKDVGIESVVPRDLTSYIKGGHSSIGEELDPLDIDGARAAVRSYDPRVEAFAVSGYFGVRNPAHELTVRKLIREITGKPVTCGHELTTQLHAPRRALTVAMNARLIPLLDELIQTVRQMLVEQAIDAPLMVVKGDGSLVDSDMALERPVETILSGPAASVVGAGFLADVDEAFVVDMGGTTTDIAVMRGGRPVLNPRGAHVNGWQIMIEAIDARTTGLGGDSDISLDETGGICAGPQRVIPLCLLAEQHPKVLDCLRSQRRMLREGVNDIDVSVLGRFVMHQRRLSPKGGRLTDSQMAIWRCLEQGPVSLLELLADAEYPPIYRRNLNRLIADGLLVASGFTPTDALHALGTYCPWSVAASDCGADILAGRLRTDSKTFCNRVLAQVEMRMGRAIMASALAEEDLSFSESDAGVGRFLIDRALGANGVGSPGSFSVSVAMNLPLVAIGAPAESYMPKVSRTLAAQLCIPEYAEVDNAIGAAVAGVAQTVRVLIQSAEEGQVFKVFLPYAVKNFMKLEDAVACAKTEARHLAAEKAERAGAVDITTHVDRRDKIAKVLNDTVDEIYIDTEVMATATGRPQLS